MTDQELKIYDQIQSQIHSIREVQVMLDRDLAKLYGVQPIRLREQFKRNIERFPEDFAFQLSKFEVESMVSQNAIPSKQHLGGALPYVFTEQGVAMLSGILRSKKAIEVNIHIMRAFVSMRKFLTKNASVFQRIGTVEQKLLEHDNKITRIFDVIESKQITPNQGIFFEGEVFDGYKFISDVISKAKSSLILIDNYVDESVLTLFSERETDIEVFIYTKNRSNKLNLAVKKFNEQYPEITLRQFSSAHDRFLIVDRKKVLHIGASLKDLGKKWFAFSQLHIDASVILEKLEGGTNA